MLLHIAAIAPTNVVVPVGFVAKHFAAPYLQVTDLAESLVSFDYPVAVKNGGLHIYLNHLIAKARFDQPSQWH